MTSRGVASPGDVAAKAVLLDITCSFKSSAKGGEPCEGSTDDELLDLCGRVWDGEHSSVAEQPRESVLLAEPGSAGNLLAFRIA